MSGSLRDFFDTMYVEIMANQLWHFDKQFTAEFLMILTANSHHD